MHTWFETVVNYEKTAEDGRIVKVNERYLVDALSHAEAENRIIEEMKPFISGEFKVTKVVNKKINEIFYNENGDKWFRAKVNYVSLDEEKGIEKKTGVTMLVQAYVKGAVTLLNIGRAHTRRFIMSDKRQILIHHTDKSVIVEKC